MPKQKSITPEDVFIKIEALAAAAQFLTENTEERKAGLDILEIIENIANKAQRDINHVA